MAEYTPGPWAWHGNAATQSIYLATTHSGRRYVMGFNRWGMRGAQPTFQPADRGLVPASDLLQFVVGDHDVVGVKAAKENDSVYRLDIRAVDCPDARLIAAAPELLEALVNLLATVDVLARRDGWADNGQREAARAAIAKATDGEG